jgi:hypothetical protein
VSFWLRLPAGAAAFATVCATLGGSPLPLAARLNSPLAIAASMR